MIIHGYKIVFLFVGWSYAVPTVYEKIKILKIFNYWKKVYDGNAISRESVNKMLPEKMEDIFYNTLLDYYNYKTSWSTFKPKKR